MTTDSLETRLARLEEIVRDLEGDELELDDALALFAEAVSHLRETETLLEGAQLRVDELLGSMERPELRPLDDTTDDEPTPAASPDDP